MPDTFKWVSVDDSGGATETTTNLSDGSPFNVVDFRGRGIPESKWSINSGVVSFGGQFNSLQLEPRRMQLDLIMSSTTESGALTNRELVYELFKPFDTKWGSLTPTNELGNWLEITRADSSVRRIKCQVEGVVDVPNIAEDALNGIYANRVRLNLVAPYPIWTDTTEDSYSDSGLTGSFSSPIVVDIEDATWFMYPVFTVGGPFTTLTIGNTIAFNSSITSSETLTIDLNPFKKTIVDQTGAYRYDLLNINALGFSDFNINPEWFQNATTQTITFTGTGGTGDTDYTMTVYKQYIGV